MSFDPFSATLDDALAQPNAHGPAGAVWQWGGAQELLERRDHYAATPLDGMALCARHGIAPPEWLARSFLAAYDRVLNCRAKSWDDVFGQPFPKGTQLAALRRRRGSRIKVAAAVTRLVQSAPTRPVDLAFWEQVGREASEGKTNAEELYAEAIQMGVAPPYQALRRRAGAAPPAKFRKVAGIRKR